MVLSPRVKINFSDHQTSQSLMISNQFYQALPNCVWCSPVQNRHTNIKKTQTSHFFTSLFFFFLFPPKKTSRNIQVSFLWLPVLKYANSIKARDDLQSSQSVFSIISRCQFNLLLLLPFYIIKRMSMKTCYLNDCFLSADIKQQSWENRVTEQVLGNIWFWNDIINSYSKERN